MTDDLVKRLRETTHMYQVDCELKMKCADRIEELEAENAMLRADKAKAVEALREIANEERLDHMNGGFCLTDGAWVSRATLAELRMGYVDEGGYDG